MSSIIYTDSKDPHGKTIRYNVDAMTRDLAALVSMAIVEGEMVEVPDHDSDEPIFVNPDHIVSIKSKEDS